MNEEIESKIEEFIESNQLKLSCDEIIQFVNSITRFNYHLESDLLLNDVINSVKSRSENAKKLLFLTIGNKAETIVHLEECLNTNNSIANISYVLSACSEQHYNPADFVTFAKKIFKNINNIED